MQNRNRTHNIELLFSLALFSVFLFSAVFVILTGVNVYKSSVEKNDESYRLRTTFFYITEKVRSSDCMDCIGLHEFDDGTSALSIRTDIDGTIYHTYIYELDGFMYELFVKDSIEADPNMGEKLIHSGRITFTDCPNDLIKVSVTDENGKDSFIYIHPDSKGGI